MEQKSRGGLILTQLTLREGRLPNNIHELVPGDPVGKMFFVQDAGWITNGNGTRNRICIFKCQCGREIEARYSKVKFGHTKGCGECQVSHPNRLPEGVAAMRRLMSAYKSNAKARNREFSLEEEEFKAITSSLCHYCGREPSLEAMTPTGKGTYLYNGIDRVDNGAGYINSNCVSCCFLCNKFKGVVSQSEFLQGVKAIYEFQHFKGAWGDASVCIVQRHSSRLVLVDRGESTWDD